MYFTSGTQEGTPIDRMLGRIARTYRLERTVVPPNQSSGKSYFLQRLLKEVVFSESGLAGTDLKWERRRGFLALGAYVAIGLVSAAILTAWGISYFGNQRYGALSPNTDRDAWADVANIRFVRVGSGTEGEAAYSNEASILFGTVVAPTVREEVARRVGAR